MIGACLADAIRRAAEVRHGKPEVITRAWTSRPYLTRWLVSEYRGRKVFLHHFQDSDADEMHDHPWNFVSVILSGGYWEKTPARGPLTWNGTGPTREQWYGPGRVLVRPLNWIHSVRLPHGPGGPRDCWTLLYIGPKVRPWGFWCPKAGWVPWKKHLMNFYKTGAGCPE